MRAGIVIVLFAACGTPAGPVVPATTSTPTSSSTATPSATPTSTPTSTPASAPGVSADLLKDCAALAVGFESSPPPADRARRACEDLAGRLGAADAQLSAACPKDGHDAAACSLLGASRMGYRTLSVRVELWVPRCKGADCQGHEKRSERLGFAGPIHDESAGDGAWKTACDAGDVASCLEQAERTGRADPGAATSLHRDLCLNHAEPGSCAEAAYQIALIGRIADAPLLAAAQKVLAARCDGGAGLACNNLGFFIEKKLIDPKNDDGASLRYQAACRSGTAVGCDNLVALAAKNPRIVRSVTWGDAARTLESACDERREGTRRHCAAFGVVLQRGFGHRADPKQGGDLLKRLCKAGFQDACR